MDGVLLLEEASSAFRGEPFPESEEEPDVVLDEDPLTGVTVAARRSSVLSEGREQPEPDKKRSHSFCFSRSHTRARSYLVTLAWMVSEAAASNPPMYPLACCCPMYLVLERRELKIHS